MDYHSMSLADLKLVAKCHTPRIKKYYIKSKLELIQLLTSKELPESMRIEKMRIQELREEAKRRGYVANIWRMRRADLVELLYPSTHQHYKNDDHTQKHDNPQERECKDIGV
jgi:hypothetical protein